MADIETGGNPPTSGGSFGSSGGTAVAPPPASPGAGQITSYSNQGSNEANQVLQDFLSFGYYPTQSEVASFIQSDTVLGDTTSESSGLANSLTDSFIGQYVQNIQANNARVASDPLAAFQEQAQQVAQQQQQQSTNLYSQAQQVFQNAPQLFGSLSPDQITEYLAPLQTAFTQAQSQTQAQEAARGLTGSNIEANALQTGNTNFQNQVLQTGLQIGTTAQTNVGNLLQTQAGVLQTASNNNTALSGQASGQLSSQDLAQQNYLNSLPFLYGQASQQSQAAQLAIKQAQNASAGGGGIGSTVGTIGGGIIGGIYGGPAGAAAGASIGGSVGGGIGNAVSPGTTGVQPGYSQGLPSGLQLLSQVKASQPQTPTQTPNYLGGLTQPQIQPQGNQLAGSQTA